jgi:type II secretion system protein N
MVSARTGLHLIGYGIFAATLFFALITATFPYAETISSLLAPMGLNVIFQRQAMNFPIGARLWNVKLISADQRLLIQSPDLTIAPLIARFFLGQLCLNVRARIFGGVIDVSVRGRAQSGTILGFHFDSLNVAQMSSVTGEANLPPGAADTGEAPYSLGAILSGELSGSGSAQLMGPDIITARADVILFGRDIKAVIANGLPPLELGMVTGSIVLDHGIVTLKNVRTYGRYGDLGANGEIYLGSDLANSILHLTLWLKPTPSARATFGMLLNMLPHSPGTGPYYVEGALKFPVVG